MKRLSLHFTVLLVLATAMFSAPAHAQKDESRKQIEARLEQRYAQLLKAEDQGKVGETWQGFVEAVEKRANGDAQIKKLIDDENVDRKRLYESIAAEDKDREKVTASLVGERNALRKFQKARPDHFLKSKNGEWVQKKDLDRLKKDGRIGETWDGYLSPVSDADKNDAKVSALVDLVNRLRRDEYMQAARDQKKTVNEAAAAGGAQNLAKVPAGEWYLLKDGQWQKKS